MVGGLGITLLAALGAALVLGAIAHRLGLAPMIGYIAAGLAVGPFTPGFVANREQVLELADIGVALLMFSIGLRFSIRELATVGRMALLIAPLQVAVTMAIATGIGVTLGWPLIEALFVAAAVAVCSSVVLVKVAGDAELKTTGHGQLAIGVSVVQDLLTVILVVVLSALGAASTNPALEVARATAVAALFVGGVVILGSRILPPLLGRVAALGSRELFIIAVAVLAIGTAVLANRLGISVALGAFVAGLALAESDLTASVLGEIVPLRELFATLFFVSIGILLEPSAVLAGLPLVLLLLALITLGKWLPITSIAVLGGERPAVAVRAGGLLAQSGEFSFVLASAGLAVGAVAPETFSLAMGAVVVSVVLAGPLYALAGRVAGPVDRILGVRDQLPGAEEIAAGLRRHAVILGYGHVGRTVARVLDARGFRWVAIDSDYARVRGAREQGQPVIYGDAGAPSVLDEAHIADAHVLVAALPDPLAGRQAVEYARRRNPRIEMVARAHSEGEEEELRRAGVTRVVSAERQLGNELVRHALRRFGVSDREVAAILTPRRE
jgi:CPA2 family monovalent cation:H+ antiporter-2